MKLEDLLRECPLLRLRKQSQEWHKITENETYARAADWLRAHGIVTVEEALTAIETLGDGFDDAYQDGKDAAYDAVDALAKGSEDE